MRTFFQFTVHSANATTTFSFDLKFTLDGHVIPFYYEDGFNQPAGKVMINNLANNTSQQVVGYIETNGNANISLPVLLKAEIVERLAGQTVYHIQNDFTPRNNVDTVTKLIQKYSFKRTEYDNLSAVEVTGLKRSMAFWRTMAPAHFIFTCANALQSAVVFNSSQGTLNSSFEIIKGGCFATIGQPILLFKKEWQIFNVGFWARLY